MSVPQQTGVVTITAASEPTRSYEREFARLLGVAHATAFAYARHALVGCLAAAGLQPGDEVILSSLTCKIVPLALLSLELKPVYVDICADTLNLDPAAVAAAIGPATRAVLFQHTYGNSRGIMEVARHAAAGGIPLIEDCAQCTPERAHAQAPGTWGQAAVFSNNLRKPVPAGSGGVAVTNDDRLAERLRELRDALPRRNVVSEAMLRVEMWIHAHILRPRLYWPLYELHMKVRGHHTARSVAEEIEAEVQRVAHCASNYQMRVGLQWLREIDTIVGHRRLCVDEYAAALSEVDGITLPCLASPESLYYFPVLVDDKDALLQAARRQRVELIAWPVRTPIYPIERYEELARLGYDRGSSPVAEDVARRLVGLPTDLATQAPQRAMLVQLLRRHHGSVH